MPRSKLPRNIGRARRLRRTMSLPEVLLWRALRKSPEGIKVRRQHAVGGYVLDFYVASRNLAIEIDGQAHDMGDRPERDIARDEWLREQGIEVVRILASDVLRDPDEIADSIVRYCQGE